MFSGLGQLVAIHPPPSDGTSKKVPPPTPVRFPDFIPQPVTDDNSLLLNTPLVPLLQTVIRPADIRPSHFEALGIHVIPNAPSENIIPDASYLPPFDQWRLIPPEALPEATQRSKRQLNNGNLSPGVQTYQERRNELLISNTAAFRTIRRLPAPPGEASVRLGNAYEFFKNLEIFAGYWDDTSLPTPSNDEDKKESKDHADEETPPHLRPSERTGTGSQLPHEYRQHLLTAFLKLVAYDFGCNVSFPRCEPRLLLTPSLLSKEKGSNSSSYFNSSATFVYRTPTDRSSARSGILEGPLCALSARSSTAFATPLDSHLDLAREIIAILLTAQQRARKDKSEVRPGQDKWWTTVPRWGGGTGGPIGKEADSEVSSTIGEKADREKVVEEARRLIGEPASKRKRGNLPAYEKYRKLLPPSSTWDRKTRYSAIGKIEGAGYDDIFLVSALNHHVSILRARVPEKLLNVLGGEGGRTGETKIWRSKWYDLFLPSERIEAMESVWGMMAYLMRAPAEDTISEPTHTK